MSQESHKISTSAQEIVFDHVVKTYSNSASPAVDDLSLTVPAGRSACCSARPAAARPPR